MSFENLGLSAELVRGVLDKGYREPTPVQAQAIPLILEARDLLARAQTGTGKTAAFTLPMLQHLSTGERQKRRNVRALILTPTRELAAQVTESVTDYGAHLRLRTVMLIGGLSIRPQITRLQAGADIVVATPGRLLDHVNQRTIDLSHVEMFVLDEADRMLDMGFIRDIRRVITVLPKEKQSLLFSATFSTEIRQLANGLLRNPAEVIITPHNSAAERIDHSVHPVARRSKRALLTHLIATGNWRRVLVFTRTKHGANRLAEMLSEDGLSAAAIHGNKSQGARTRALNDFKSGAVRVLVATDIAARGIDIEDLPHVVNYELPNVPEDYVHRIGRTGRAGRAGHAVSLVSAEENGLLKGIEAVLRQQLERTVVEGFEPNESDAQEDRNAARQEAQRRRPPRQWKSNRTQHSGRPTTGGKHPSPGRRTSGQERPAQSATAGKPTQRKRRPAQRPSAR